MIHVTIDIDQFNVNAMALEVEHIGQLINQGYTQGEGWTLSGEPEKEPDTIQVEEEEHKDDEELMDDILNNR